MVLGMYQPCENVENNDVELNFLANPLVEKD